MPRFLALACLLLLVSAPVAVAGPRHASAVTGNASALPTRRAVPSLATRSPRAQKAAKLGQDATGAPITITLGLKPRNAAGLAALANRPSGAPGVPISRLRRLFAPSRTVTGAADAYLRRYGFRLTTGGILTRSYTGTVGDAERAFQTTIGRFQAGSIHFRRPTTPTSLPSQLATAVSGISGLDSYPTYHPLSTTSRTTAKTVTASCSAPSTIQATYGGYQPPQLAAGSGYDYQPLLDMGANGHGDVIALLEFSTYSPSETAAYQSCYGTSVPNSDVLVNGGTTYSGGSAEVELDQEVAATAAPGLNHMYTYIGDGSGGYAPVLDRMLTDRPTTGTTEISISWGACEDAVNFWDMYQTDNELQLAAAAGVSVFAASGDSGASGCYPFTGSTYPWVSYPSSSPYLTSVGGTTLYAGASGAYLERTWGTPATLSGGGGGGGFSIYNGMPSWQSGPGVISVYSNTMCGSYCREVPDVALDGNPDTGYIVRLDGSWTIEGGTSAAAPLLAAMTADANSYSLAFGGTRVGFANPFFYQHAGTPLFRDVTMGTNSILGTATYPATYGYDMASGLGAPDALVYAEKLLGRTDTTAPTVTLSTPSNGFVATSTPGFTGTAGAALGDAASVTVRLYSGTSTSGSLARTLTAPVSGGTWTVTPSPAIPDGTYTAQAVQTDAAANVGGSPPVTFTIDTITPTVTLTSPRVGSSTSATQPTLSGSAGGQANDSTTVDVAVYAGTDTSGALLETLHATRNGTSWSIAPSSPLAEGAYTAQATQADAAAHVGQSAPVSFTVDTTAPAVTLDTPASAWVTTSTPTLSGTAGSAPGDSSTVTVRIYIGPNVNGWLLLRPSSVAVSGGAWTITPSSPISDGTYTAQVVQADAAGNVGEATTTFTIDTVTPPVTVTAPLAKIYTQNTQPTFSGRASSGLNDAATVNVNIYAGTGTLGSLVATLPATRSGTSWSVAPSSPLADDTYTAQATQSDAAGHVGHSTPITFTADSTLHSTGLSASSTPHTLIATTPVTLHGVLTDQTTGLPVAGQVISIIGFYYYRATTRPITFAATTNSSGVWTRKITTSVVRARFTWHALYRGAPGIAFQATTPQVICVRPTLTAVSGAAWNGRYYTVTHRHTFILKGTARPIMAGRKLTVQRRTTGAWHSTKRHVVISATGSYAVKLYFKAPGKQWLRFAYTGSTTGPWLSAVSPGLLFISK